MYYIFRRPFSSLQVSCVWSTVDTGHYFAASVFSEVQAEEGEPIWWYMGLIGYAGEVNMVEKGKTNMKGNCQIWGLNNLDVDGAIQ